MKTFRWTMPEPHHPPSPVGRSINADIQRKNPLAITLIYEHRIMGGIQRALGLEKFREA